MATTTYQVHVEGVPDFVAEYNAGDPNTITRGDTATFAFETALADAGEDLIVRAGFEYTVPAGTTEEYDDVYVESGGTLTIKATATLNCNELTVEGTINENGTLTVQSGLVATGSVAELFEWAGKYTTLETLDSTVKYREQIPADLAIDSLVLGIEPATALQEQDVRGVWGIVDGITDTRNSALTTDRYQFDVLVLGRYNAFTDYADVQTTLEI
jgi:hypothetical protein